MHVDIICVLQENFVFTQTCKFHVWFPNRFLLYRIQAEGFAAKSDVLYMHATSQLSQCNIAILIEKLAWEIYKRSNVFATIWTIACLKGQ